MTKNKRYLNIIPNGIQDTETGKIIHGSKIGDLLNKQEETIQRLKQTMKGVAEILSINADLFSDKAIEHDMNAYRELQEFDNKDVFLMAVSIKEAIKILKGDVE